MTGRLPHYWGVINANNEPGKWCQRCGADSGVDDEAASPCTGTPPLPAESHPSG